MTPRKTSRGGGDAPGHAGGRARGPLRLLGVLVLAGILIAFVVSFLSGLGAGDAPDRVTGDAQRGGERLDSLGPRLRVEVLNAAGVSGLARQATEHLRDRGFDVVYIGNAGSFESDSTVVVARTADVDAAHRVARALGIDSVLVEPDPQLYVDATVRLGRDWPPAGGTDAAVTGGVTDRMKRWLGADSVR